MLESEKMYTWKTRLVFPFFVLNSTSSSLDVSNHKTHVTHNLPKDFVSLSEWIHSVDAYLSGRKPQKIPKVDPIELEQEKEKRNECKSKQMTSVPLTSPQNKTAAPSHHITIHLCIPSTIQPNSNFSPFFPAQFIFIKIQPFEPGRISVQNLTKI